MPTTIHPFPELRAYAEQYAQERADARARYGHTHDTGGASWAAMGQVSRDIAVSVELNLLCDLSRDSSQDVIARMVAEKVGLPRESGAPTLFFYDGSRHRGALRGWHMHATNRHARYAQHRFCTDAENAIDAATSHPVYPETHVPGICDVVDPAEALSMIVAHLWPSEP